MRDGVMFGNFDTVKFGNWCIKPSVIESVLIYDDRIIVFTSTRGYGIEVADNLEPPIDSLACLISLPVDDFANFKAYVEREFFGIEEGEDE